jgi:autotransporter-associated beta strand protein
MRKLFQQLFPMSLNLIIVLLLSSAGATFAGSATWNLDPVSGNWNTAENWTPAVVPDGEGDVATFDVSHITDINVTITDVVEGGTVVSGVVFNPGASAYTISIVPPFSLLMNGFGVTNNSGIPQNFATAVDQSHQQSSILFSGSATAGDGIYTNPGAIVKNAFGGHVDFTTSATAGTGTFFIGGGAANLADGAGMLFFDSSSADRGTFHISGGAVNGAGNGDVEFVNTSSAGRGTFFAEGGVGGGEGARVFFLDDSKGGSANITVSGNGNIDLSLHNPPGVTIGALQGDGLVFLGSTSLTVNNKSNLVFAGVIKDGGFAGGSRGAFAKSGKGRLDLTGASSYTGGTTISAGTLLVDNTSGSGTGTGAVNVNSGALGGNGTITGAVTVGKGTAGNGAFLTPGQSFNRPGTLTILSALTFNSDGFFNVGLSKNSVIGKVVANGVTITSGADFAFFNSRGFTVPVGTVLTIISNTAATPIAGVFDTLPDGLVFTDHGNTFQVSYEGGDGNDLTLTSIP